MFYSLIYFGRQGFEAKTDSFHQEVLEGTKHLSVSGIGFDHGKPVYPRNRGFSLCPAIELLFLFLVRGKLFPGDTVLAVGPGGQIDHPAPGRAEGAVGVPFPGGFFPATGTGYGFRRIHRCSPQ
jgi:hypothetical protein